MTTESRGILSQIATGPTTALFVVFALFMFRKWLCPPPVMVVEIENPPLEIQSEMVPLVWQYNARHEQDVDNKSDHVAIGVRNDR